MSPELIGIITVGASLAVLIIGLFAWLRQDMKEQTKELNKRIDEQGKSLAGRLDKHNERIGALEQAVSALKATIETYFRVRVDQPPPPEHHDEAA